MILLEGNKGAQWMPWHIQAMKDATNCDKLRLAVSELRPVDFRMGEPNYGYA